MRRLRAWWGRRPLRARITLTVGAVALVALLALSSLATVLAFDALVDSTDQELRVQAQQAVAQLAQGATAVPGVRVVDKAGRPVDGGPPPPLDDAQVALLGAALTAAAAALLLAIGKALPDRATALLKPLIGRLWPELLAALQAGGPVAWTASAFIVLFLALTAILVAGLARFATEGSGRHG